MFVFDRLCEAILSDEYDYRGFHKSPGPPDNAPIYDLTILYPEDIYSDNGAKYYGGGISRVYSDEMINLFRSIRGKPDAMVKIYRAVPATEKQEYSINPGDWVTPSKYYAKLHGESNLNGKYKIIFKTVPAKTLFSEANSIFEFGYHP